jgi:hypothetical protein
MLQVGLNQYKTRFPFVCCEAFCIDNDFMSSSIFANDFSLLNRLFSILDQPSPLNSTLSGYFNKIITFHIIRSPKKVNKMITYQIFDFIFKNKQNIEKIISHLSITSSIGEVLIRLLTLNCQCEEHDLNVGIPIINSIAI